jgi:hypothetical protein
MKVGVSSIFAHKTHPNSMKIFNSEFEWGILTTWEWSKSNVFDLIVFP